MTIAVSQRVVFDLKTGERRDALDQRWPQFLEQAGLFGVPVPNCEELLPSFLRRIRPRGVLLTGGNDLASLGGDAPERDAVEASLIGYAKSNDLPLLGVCRGMQIIQAQFGVPLARVEGHVAPAQRIEFEGREIDVNSYHGFGSCESAPGLKVCGRSIDGVVKAVRAGRMLGIMWHPERIEPARGEDLALFRGFFGAAE